jgi:hypothetical protein
MAVRCVPLAMVRIDISCPLYNFDGNELERTPMRRSIRLETRTFVANRGTAITDRNAREDGHPEGVITFAGAALFALQPTCS